VARAWARICGRAYVLPDDVVALVPAVLRHRLVLTPEAELDRYTPEQALTAVLASVPVPR
jgi:MoxR-like ATPase